MGSFVLFVARLSAESLRQVEELSPLASAAASANVQHTRLRSLVIVEPSLIQLHLSYCSYWKAIFLGQESPRRSEAEERVW